ncbi:UDP-glycosyltransferase 76B1-like [Impatiens glandulifera]|uniref:UDP-glycosyltransferase 76B1-like n=1 Tax=Impatiens glandulifera TaxID=253017 RepID=UPI001FB1221F|nr:UDP-glycosyltransferase 76B1-like [Impatiens glandulifera]
MENLQGGELATKKQSKCRLLLFPLPLQGHLNPMLQLANILYSKGFSITIIHTLFNSPNSSTYPHFHFHSIPLSLSQSESQSSGVDITAFLNSLNTKCAEPFRQSLAGLLSHFRQTNETVGCLITDAVWYFSQTIADELKINRIILRTSNITCFLAFSYFPLLRKKGYIPQQDPQMDDEVPDLPPLRVKDIPTVKSTDPETLEKLLNNMIDAAKRSSGIIFNSCDLLEQSELIKLRRELNVPIFTIGPFNKLFPAAASSLLVQDRSSISWLDKQEPKSVLYVSFGSLVTLSKTEFVEIATGLANSGKPFLWVVRVGLVRGSGWLEGLPDGFSDEIEGRGYIVKWAPQEEVLGHPAVGGFWTHSGWNSTLESICEGIPMMCFPIAGDQMVNARYVSFVWKIGIQIEEKLDRERVEKGIRRLMIEEKEEMTEKAMDLKRKVDDCLKEDDGSSYRNMKDLFAHILSFY